MNNPEVEILNQLLKAIDQKNFDLSVWKIKTNLLIKKLFGEADDKLKLIDALHYDYSSWSLRDQSGSKQADAVKEQARGIIEAAIMELSVSSSNDVINELRNDLTGSQLDQLQQLIKQTNVDEKALADFFSKISPEVKDRVLARLILNTNR